MSCVGEREHVIISPIPIPQDESSPEKVLLALDHLIHMDVK